MNLPKQIYPAVMIMLIFTLITGVIYPLLVTGLSQVLFKSKAQGSLIYKNGEIAGSRLIGQTFNGPGYFHSRPSAAGNGYDPMASGGTNYGPTNKKLIDNVKGAAETLRKENPQTPIPVDLVTSSGSGLDPHITPAAAEFQIARVARERRMSPEEVRRLVKEHTEGRQFGFLGEPRVNVLELNLALDAVHPMPR
ncbi:MAG: potassium-transporting ATPase subunit C [Candidatus Dadabacteria bacterium]